MGGYREQAFFPYCMVKVFDRVPHSTKKQVPRLQLETSLDKHLYPAIDDEDLLTYLSLLYSDHDLRFQRYHPVFSSNMRPTKDGVGIMSM